MKTKVMLIILISFLLSACCWQPFTKDDKTPPINLQLDQSLNIRIIDGQIAVVDEKGEVISRPVQTPIKLYSDDGSYKAKTLEGIENINVLTIRGSCTFLMCSRNGCCEARLPDTHPLCNQ